MNEFEVGTKIWFINSDSPGVRLLLVTEEIVKKTISGNTREYVFQVIHKGLAKDISSSQLNGTFFKKREEAFDFMHQQAANAINVMMDKATDMFKLAEVVSQEENDFNQKEVNLSEDIIIELPGGQQARVKGGIPV
tara:strand:+ start:7960 stop:8367 length:408 start_codon:yes stop_codon:yes gene_type:complete